MHPYHCHSASQLSHQDGGSVCMIDSYLRSNTTKDQMKYKLLICTSTPCVGRSTEFRNGSCWIIPGTLTNRRSLSQHEYWNNSNHVSMECGRSMVYLQKHTNTHKHACTNVCTDTNTHINEILSLSCDILANRHTYTYPMANTLRSAV